MALSPLVSWRLRDNSSTWSRWDIGVVDAGTTSNDFGFLIWNNYNGATDVPDMEDVSITTKDELGGNTGELVTGTWIKVRNDSLAESTFTAIGFDVVNNIPVKKSIKTTKSTTYNTVTSTPGVGTHVSSNGEIGILGVANDGNKATAQGNFVELTMNAFVPGTASAGLVNFLTRVSYKYV